MEHFPREQRRHSFHGMERPRNLQPAGNMLELDSSMWPASRVQELELSGMLLVLCDVCALAQVFEPRYVSLHGWAHERTRTHRQS